VRDGFDTQTNPAFGTPWIYGSIEPDFRSFYPFSTSAGTTVLNGFVYWGGDASTAAVGKKNLKRCGRRSVRGVILLRTTFETRLYSFFIAPASGLYDINGAFSAGDIDAVNVGVPLTKGGFPRRGI
jgi:hypothetical protein